MLILPLPSFIFSNTHIYIHLKSEKNTEQVAFNQVKKSHTFSCGLEDWGRVEVEGATEVAPVAAVSLVPRIFSAHSIAWPRLAPAMKESIEDMSL